jgi:hypothetical protein
MVISEGIAGLTKLFRESLAVVPEGSIVVFLGSEAVCSPFAQLLAYAVRDRKMSFGFSPKAVWEKCYLMTWMDGVGYQIGPEKMDPAHANVVVILGGLAMPKFGCPVDNVNSYIEKVEKRPLVVGVGFMDIFRRSGWNELIRFDTLMNSYMDAENVI